MNNSRKESCDKKRKIHDCSQGNRRDSYHFDLTADCLIGEKSDLNIEKVLQQIARYFPNLQEVKSFYQCFSRGQMLKVFEKGKSEISKEVLAYFGDESIRPVRYHAQLLKNPNTNHIECILYGMDISIEKDQYEQNLKEQLAIFNALAAAYSNVFLIHQDTAEVKVLKLNGYVTTGIDKDANRSYQYEKVLKQYITERVYSQDQQLLLKDLSFEQVKKELSDKSEYTGNYRALVDGEIHYFQYKYVKVENVDAYIAAFQNTDDIVASELEQRKLKEEQIKIFNCLARGFKDVYIVNMKLGTAKILKCEDARISPILKNIQDDEFTFQPFLEQWIMEDVYSEDQEKLRKQLSIQNLREVFSKQKEYTGSYRIFKNNRIIHYQFNLSISDDENVIVAGFQNIEDIIQKHLLEEKKQREKELAHQKRLEEQLAIFEILSRDYRNVYIANIYTGSAKILKLSPGYEFDALEKFKDQEFSYEQVINTWIENRVHYEDRDRLRYQLSTENLSQVLSGHDYVSTYRSIENGQLHHYQLFVAKLDQKGNVIAAFQLIDKIIEDHLIQEKKEKEKEAAYQKQLIRAKQEAERANRAKTDFLLQMSHDIRTPLNGILGMLEVASYSHDDLQKRDDCLAKVKESAYILLELINEVLDMNKLESGKIVLEHIPFDLKEISRNVFTMINRQAEVRGIEIIEEDCKAPHAQLIGSPVHLKRIMMNILSNAIKYNKDHGKIYITCREISSEGNQMKLEFKCRDTGVGMSEDFLKHHLFEPFTQERPNSRSKFGGTGLGMSITKKVVDLMDGSITVESKKGEGTSIDVILPFEIDLSKKEENPMEMQDVVSMQGLKILIVEDNELNMEIAKAMFEHEGVTVLEATNGQEAVDAFRKSQPYEIDAILMDVMMPIMNGYKATQKIRNLNRKDAKQIPIIAMTASAFAEDRIKAKQAGMNEHLSKPISVQQMVKVVSSCVSNYRQKTKE